MPLLCLTSCGRRRPKAKAAPNEEAAPSTSPTVQIQQPSLVPHELSNVLSYIPAPLHQLPVGTVIAIPARRYAARSYVAHPNAAPSPSQPVVREIQAWLDATAGHHHGWLGRMQRAVQVEGLSQQTPPPHPSPSTPVRPYGTVMQDVQGWVEDADAEPTPLPHRSRRHRLPTGQTRPTLTQRSSSVSPRWSLSSSGAEDPAELDRLSTAVVVGGQVQLRQNVNPGEVFSATRRAMRPVRDETRPMVSAGVAAQEARRSRSTMYGAPAYDFSSPPPPYPSTSPPPPYRSIAGSPAPESSEPGIHHTAAVTHSQRPLMRTALMEAMRRADERTRRAGSGGRAEAVKEGRRVRARLRGLMEMSRLETRTGH